MLAILPLNETGLLKVMMLPSHLGAVAMAFFGVYGAPLQHNAILPPTRSTSPGPITQLHLFMVSVVANLHSPLPLQSEWQNPSALVQSSLQSCKGLSSRKSLIVVSKPSMSIVLSTVSMKPSLCLDTTTS